MVSTVTYKGIPFDLMSSEFEGVRRLKTDGTPKDFLFEVAKGDVDGHSTIGFITKNDNVGTTTVDLWNDSSVMVYPASPETWEIVSDNVNDHATGSGGRVAVVITLDENFLRVTNVVPLNGTTPVVLSGLHTRPHQIIINESGSSTVNEGRVILRDTATGNLRGTVKVGEALSFDGHFTVPADKRAFIMQTYTNFPKNLDGVSLTTIRDAGNPNASWITATSLNVYQSFIPFEVKAFFPLAPKTDLRAAASLSTGSGQVTIIYEMVLVDLV